MIIYMSHRLMSHGVSWIDLERLLCLRSNTKIYKKKQTNNNIKMNHFCTAKRYMSAVPILISIAKSAYCYNSTSTTISMAQLFNIPKRTDLNRPIYFSDLSEICQTLFLIKKNLRQVLGKRRIKYILFC